MARSHHEPDSIDSSSIKLPSPQDQGYNDNQPRPSRRSLVDQDIQKAEALRWLEDTDHYSTFSWAIRKRAQDLQLLPRASLSHLVYLPAWREQIAQAFDFDDIDDDTDKAIITQIEPIEPDPPRAVRLQDPLPSPQRETPGSLPGTSCQHQTRRDPRRGTNEDNNLSSSDESIGLAKYYSCDITPFSTGTDGLVVKRIKRETVGTFDSDFKDYKKTGLVIVQGKQIYTDIYLFCEHLHVFQCYGDDCLQEHYTSLLGGGAQGWFMGELNARSREKLLQVSISTFCNKLVRRFKRSDAELIAELQTGKYTLQLARTDVSLTQWAQRKASLAKQIGYNEDRLILQTIFPLIDIEISRFLSIPKKRTSLTAFIQECKERRPTINIMMLRDEQLSSRRSRQGQSFDRGNRYSRSDNTQRGQQDRAQDSRRDEDGRRGEHSRRDGPQDD
ncbi:hypothetical protein EDB80DRAFT_808594 [Ilyonectria destructans]|nr:hypothetical protein EDB80DRAFT_808594 [Ilyonectria destructans]